MMKYWTKLFLEVLKDHLLVCACIALPLLAILGIIWLAVYYPGAAVIIGGIGIIALSIGEQMYKRHRRNKQ